ncbi:MAG: hypothetical protein KatS3mg002_0444 [Candidatus Woesearchaeota archaeon]|nr:MAG: hypothetical protein KatS3mg002_0444 [Candidatus Woesearchaeota archaeon]
MKIFLDHYITPTILELTNEIEVAFSFDDDPVKNFLYMHDFENLTDYLFIVYFGPFTRYQNIFKLHKNISWFNVDIQIKNKTLPKLSNSCIKHLDTDVFVFSKTIIYKEPSSVELIFDLEDNIYVNAR